MDATYIQRVILTCQIDVFNNLATWLPSGQFGKLYAMSPFLATSWELRNPSDDTIPDTCRFSIPMQFLMRLSAPCAWSWSWFMRWGIAWIWGSIWKRGTESTGGIVSGDLSWRRVIISSSRIKSGSLSWGRRTMLTHQPRSFTLNSAIATSITFLHHQILHIWLNILLSVTQAQRSRSIRSQSNWMDMIRSCWNMNWNNMWHRSGQGTDEKTRRLALLMFPYTPESTPEVESIKRHFRVEIRFSLESIRNYLKAALFPVDPD